jgi:aminopeptidase N
MFMIIFLCTQWTTDNIEAKYACPCPHAYVDRAESTHAYNVLKYELDVRVPMTERSLQGTNQILCMSRENGLTTAVLHSHTLTIDAVEVDGQNTTYSTSADSLIIDLPTPYNTGDVFTVAITYHGSWSVTPSQVGFVYYPKQYDSWVFHSIAYTLGEPWDARTWMPCYDEPYDKADSGCVISVTVPDSFVVCANGELINVTYNPDTTKTYTWKEQYPIATYLMHFGASRYAQWSDWWHDAQDDSVEIRHFVWPEDSAQSVTAFQHLPAAMALFDSMYGPYPFDRYGQDVVYPYEWGGMEHQEQSTIHRDWVIYQSDRGMAHELSHMWWGDMVTCVDFRDIWLNEGCATYSDANYIWHLYGYGEFRNLMMQRRSYYLQADNAHRRPLYDPPPAQIFNYGYTYCKACWVMHMLRGVDVFTTGTDTTYFTAMAAYRDSFEYGVASTDDMNAVFSYVYGYDMTWFFDEWVYGQGHPEYHVFWVCEPYNQDYLVKIKINQIQTNAPVFHMPVQIALSTTSGDTTVGMTITSNVEYAEFTTSDSVTSIDFDPNGWVLKEHQVFYGVEEYADERYSLGGLSFSSNPARDVTISYSVPQRGAVRLALYDVSGRLQKNLYAGVQTVGQHEIRVPDLSAGVYFCRLVTAATEETKKLVIID